MSQPSKPPLGSIVWKDLTVQNAEETQHFYAEVVGWRSEPVDMGDYNDFNMLLPSGGEPIAGVCHARGSNASIPPQWLIYIAVKDVDQASARCIELGGKVVDGPRAIGNSRFCVIQDPGGAVVALINASDSG